MVVCEYHRPDGGLSIRQAIPKRLRVRPAKEENTDGRTESYYNAWMHDFSNARVERCFQVSRAESVRYVTLFKARGHYWCFRGIVALHVSVYSS